ncbi:hypothetical protein O3M35_009732 [Rhynocoris fuscipes]|uniref:Amidase domain-containing protein n=1 Tax=Rhynocoris fuscipes TaxID=488301 RepID=A0AAW1D6R1_9HEMI
MSYETIAKIINKIVRIFFILLGYIATIRTLFACFGKSKQLPPIKSDLLKISATQLAVKIRRKEVKSVDVIEAYINRIKDVNPMINAVVDQRFAEAMDEAVRADLLVEAAENAEEFANSKPLLGVPITVKETIPVKGLSNNAARSRIASNIANEDADCIQLLRKHGAIPLLVSNIPELCLYLETNNAYIGRTNNPYNTTRTSGGSSGGEAALIGSGASLLGVGSDVAGSIRLPSMFCGIFGHKPTPGFVSNNGHIPSSKDPMWHYYFTIGPLARYAEDLPLILRCMISEKSHLQRLSLDSNVNVTRVKVYYMYGEGPDSTLQDEPNFQMKKAIKTAVDIMGINFQCTTTKVDLSYFKNSFALTMLILKTKGIENVYQKDDENPDDYNAWRILEIMFKKFTFQNKASLSGILFGPLQSLINAMPEVMIEKLVKRLEYTRGKLLELLGNDGVLIYPTFSNEATFHDRLSGQILNISYCTLFNVLGFPVTQCHVRYTREGLPVGVQIVAAPEKDRLSLAVAEAISTVTGGWLSPDEVKASQY